MKTRIEWDEDKMKCTLRFHDREQIRVRVPAGLYPAGAVLTGEELSSIIKHHPEGGEAVFVYRPEEKDWIAAESEAMTGSGITLSEYVRNRYGRLQYAASKEEDERYLACRSEDGEKVRFFFERGYWILSCSGKLKHIRTVSRMLINVKSGLTYLTEPAPDGGAKGWRVRTVSMNAVTGAIASPVFAGCDPRLVTSFIREACEGFSIVSDHPLPEETDDTFFHLNRFLYGLRYPYPLPEEEDASAWMLKYLLSGLKKEMPPMEVFDKMANNLGLRNTGLFRENMTDWQVARDVTVMAKLGFRDPNVIFDTARKNQNLSDLALNIKMFGRDATIRVVRKFIKALIRQTGEPAAAGWLAECLEPFELVDISVLYDTLVSGDFFPSLKGSVREIHDRLKRDLSIIQSLKDHLAKKYLR